MLANLTSSACPQLNAEFCFPAQDKLLRTARCNRSQNEVSLAACNTLAYIRGEREGYGGPRDVTSLSLSIAHVLSLHRGSWSFSGTAR